MVVRLLGLFLFIVLHAAQINAQDWQKIYTELYQQGDVFYYAATYDSALVRFEEAYSVANEHLSKDEIYDGLFAIILTQRKQQQLEQANNTTEVGLEKHKSLFDNAQLSQLHNYLGLLNNERAEYELALSNFAQARQFSKLNDDTLAFGNQLINASLSHIYLNNYNAAESILKEAASLEIEDDSFNAFLNLTYFNIYNYRKEDINGYDFLVKAYEFSQRTNDTNRYLNVLVQLSYYHINQNNYREGLAYANEGIGLAQKRNYLVLMARFSDILGRIYTVLNEFEIAINYYNEAVNIYERNGNGDLASILKIQISGLLIQQNELALAEEILRSLLETDISATRRNRVFTGLADIEGLRENHTEAREYLNLALAELDENTFSESNYIFERFLSNPTVPNNEKIEYARNSWNASKTRGKYAEMLSEIQLAKAFVTMNADSALKYAYHAVDKLEKRRYSTSASSIKNKLNINWQAFYYQIAEWEVAQNRNHEKAFELFELSKSRTLFDQIYENQQAELLVPEDPSSIRIMELQKKIDQHYQSLENYALEENSEYKLLQLSQLELDYQTEIDALISTSKRWAELEYPEVTSLREAQALLDDKTAYLSYGMRGEHLYIFLIKKEQELFLPIYFGDKAQMVLTEQVNQFRDAIVNIAEQEEIHEVSKPLLDQIFAPIADELIGIEHLIISPDGPLHLLPFEALRVNDKFLIEQFTVKYLPSISVYDAIEHPNIQDFSKDLLAMAGSGFESGDDFFGSSSQVSFATLPYSLSEVDSISNYFSNSTILKNEEVTEVAFKNLSLHDYRFIHLATHGNIDERLPDQSGLILSKKMGTESLFGEDGYLNAREITQLNIPAELVVLSACNTGNGKVITGEGVMGLQRSMLAAGASSVVVSLWNIFDRSTPQFMNIFYEQLLAFEEEEISFLDKVKMLTSFYQPELVDYKTLALQQTKIEMIDHPYYWHPVHWAPFILTGK